MAERYKNKYRSDSNRLQGHDYSSGGVYFITVVTAKHICEFGYVENKIMKLNTFGEIVESEWLKTQKMRKDVLLGEFCVMPNHFHALIYFKTDGFTLENKQLFKTPFYKNQFGPQKNSIGTIVRGFKGSCKSKIIKAGNKSFEWHSNYHDVIIRNEKRLHNVKQYIRNNPANWDKDSLLSAR